MRVPKSLRTPLVAGMVWFLLVFNGKPALGEEHPEETEKLRYTSWGILYGWTNSGEEAKDRAKDAIDEYTSMLLSSLKYALRQEGFEISFQEELKGSRAAAGPVLSEEGGLSSVLYGFERAQETKSRWLVVVRTYRERTRFSWYMGIYDGLSQSLVVSDSSFLFPGLSALPQLDETVGRILASWKEKQKEPIKPIEVVEHRQLFKGTQQGISVFFGDSAQGVAVGTLEGGDGARPLCSL
ncbi:hypothetical protein [Treponema sp. J25]|uniref:hypothetical protein n=1 Tax=Treponema sp. J25 TaxID=2094121 RepID=UPI0010493CC8|nr:hypothetical protein [Treponema sp. J25]TCW60077.1 hypothetical protein C5O22_13445 [Treponema sp. J25]